ncbi:MAG: hypothetical protein ACF8LK_06315 [Phycisphaerales bacterium JB041]
MSRKPTGPSLPASPSTAARELRHHDSAAIGGAATRDIKSPLAPPPGAGGPGGGGPGGGGVNPGGGDPAESISIPLAINCVRRPRL